MLLVIAVLIWIPKLTKIGVGVAGALGALWLLLSRLIPRPTPPPKQPDPAPDIPAPDTTSAQDRHEIHTTTDAAIAEASEANGADPAVVADLVGMADADR